MDYENENERERRERRRRMIEQRKRKNRRLRLIYGLIRFFGPYAAGAVVLVVLVIAGVNAFGGKASAEDKNESQESVQQESVQQESVQQNNLQAHQGQENGTQAGDMPRAGAAGIGAESGDSGLPGNTAGSNPAGGTQTDVAPYPANAQPDKRYEAHITASTKQLGEEIDSNYAILIDMETGDILAQKGWDTVINPASMTKILTVLVAAEHVENLDDTFTITLNETDYSYENDCSNVGFAKDEVVTVRDLLYGTILHSGGDAAAALAAYVAGTREAFVDLMNEKLVELGLSDTAHVTNCVGLYDEEHYCTVYDMAMILQAAMDNELCREVLTAHTYITSKTPQHPEGIRISNWFLRRIEDKDTGGEVLYAKTGYVAQAKNCAASYQLADSGKGYLCVTAQADSGWKCIYDHVALYKEYA